MASACQPEPIRTVVKPPILSEITPQAWRLRNAVPSSIDNISALIVRLMPRSLQNATRCPCGIDIGMQHRIAATHIIANTTFGGSPSTRALVGLPFAAAGG